MSELRSGSDANVDNEVDTSEDEDELMMGAEVRYLCLSIWLNVVTPFFARKTAVKFMAPSASLLLAVYRQRGGSWVQAPPH